jgi:hypothetical protein
MGIVKFTKDLQVKELYCARSENVVTNRLCILRPEHNVPDKFSTHVTLIRQTGDTGAEAVFVSHTNTPDNEFVDAPSVMFCGKG